MNTLRKHRRYRRGRDLRVERLEFRRVLASVLDTTFDEGVEPAGIVTTDFTEGGNDDCREVAIQADGKIVAVGVAGAVSDSDQPDMAGGNRPSEETAETLVTIHGGRDVRGGGGGGRGGRVSTSDARGGGGGGGGNGGHGEPDPEASIPDFAIARYESNGVLDEDFGALIDPLYPELGRSGKVVTDFGPDETTLTYDEANGFVILPDGRYLVVGSTTTALDAPRDIALAIYSSTGELQTKVITDLGGDEFARKVAIQDGKVVVVGSILLPDSMTEADILVARYDLTGNLETSLILDFYGEKDEGVDVLVKEDKLIVIGHVKDTSRVEPQVFGGPLEFGLAQLKTEAGEFVLDTEFGTPVYDPVTGEMIGRTGMVSTDFNMQLTPELTPEYSTDEAWAGALQGDKILVAGRFGAKGVSDFGLARYTALGELDTHPETGFGMTNPNTGHPSGVLHTDIAGGPDACYDVAIHNGEIVVPGRYTANDKFAFAMVRYNAANGAEIEIFAAPHISDGPDQANSVAIRPDGRILLAGWAAVPTTMVDFALAQYVVTGGASAMALTLPAEQAIAEVAEEMEEPRGAPPGWGHQPGWSQRPGWSGHPWGRPQEHRAAEIAIEEVLEEEELLLPSLEEALAALR